MTFSQSVRTCLRDKYITFSGRASRSEFWWFNLFYWLVLIVLGGIILALISATGSFANGSGFSGGAIFLFVILAIVFVALFLPVLSVTIRRMHDRDISGWWYLLVLFGGNIPYIGVVISIGFLVLMALRGTDGPNRFGPDPLKPGNADIFA